MSLDIFNKTLTDFGNDCVFPQANRCDKAIVGNNCHRHGGINHRFFLVLFFGGRNVNDNQRLVVLRLNTGTFFLVQRGADKILFQSQNINQVTYFLFGRTDCAHPTAVFYGMNLSDTVVHCFIKIEHHRLPPVALGQHSEKRSPIFVWLLCNGTA